MKSCPLTGLRAMALGDGPDPEIRLPTDVLIRMGAVGVCGSDVHYYTTGRIGSQIVEYPFTVGHECAGTVVEVGHGVTRVRPGDRVAIEPAITCGQCDQCRAGRENTCRTNRFLGCPGQIEGSLAELLVMPQENCFPIDDRLSLAEAAVAEPLAIAIYAVRQAAFAPGARIGILGLGPIGRTVLLAAQDAHGGPVYATDPIDARRTAARRAGAAWVGNPQADSAVAQILEREPVGLDVVFECCGQQSALDDAVELLRPGGTLSIIGIPAIDEIHFTADKIRRRELTIKNIRRQRGCVALALALVAKQQSAIADLITHRFPLAETNSAFDLVADYQDGVVKAMIEFA